MKKSDEAENSVRCRSFIFEVLADSPHLLRCHDETGAAVFFNKAWLEFRGRRLEEEIGWGWLQGVHPDSQASIKEEMKASFARRESFELNYRLRSKEGDYHFISDRIRPYGAGELGGGFIASCFDVQDFIAQETRLSSFANALEQTADILVITDLKGTIEYVNRAFERTTGYSRGEAIGLNPRILKSGYHDQAFYRQMWERIVGGQVFTGLLINRRKDGSLYDEEVVISPLKDSEGRITRFVATGRDVTDKNEILEQLKITKAIIDNSSDAIYLITLDGHLFFASEAAEKMLGYAPGQMTGLPLSEVDVQPLSPEAFQAVVAQVRKSGRMVFEGAHRTQSGQSVEVEIAVSHMTYHAQEILCAIVRDIRWRKETQRQLRVQAEALKTLNASLEERIASELRRRMEKERLLSAIYDAANVGVSVTDDEGRFVHVNDAFCELHGYGKEELIGQSFLMLVPPEKHAFAKEGYRGFLCQGLEERGLEWSVTRKDGSSAEVLLSRKSIETEPGKRHMISFFVDVSDLKALEREHKMQEQLLIQQSKMAAMGEMIGAIAHQWRQPLNAVGLRVQGIKLDYEYNELTQERLDTAVRGVMEILMHMSATIDDFRNFFKPDKAPQSFDLVAAVKSAAALLEAQMTHNGIRIEFEVEGNPPPLRHGYPNEFKQAVLNLLSNAKDAIVENRAKGGRIRIRFENRGERVRVSIADNGGGIPETVKEKIFEPYFTTKEPGKGTGIGLYMSKMIIERSLSGRLEANNIDGGAEFVITV
ncbi:MAG: PAS domain S-box protein [Campylobacterales bacterium]